MTQTSDNNQRIAKNTLLLYFRMLFMMAVSLYTGRVILNVLGINISNYDRTTIQRIAESLLKGSFSKYDKGGYTP